MAEIGVMLFSHSVPLRRLVGFNHRESRWPALGDFNDSAPGSSLQSALLPDGEGSTRRALILAFWRSAHLARLRR